MYNTDFIPIREKISLCDVLLIELGKALFVLSNASIHNQQNFFDSVDPESSFMTVNEKKYSAKLMRINHSGEICAQALYRGQAFLCKKPEIQALFLHAAFEELNHLTWCKQRIQELNSNSSILNPFWYVGSFSIGVIAGLAGSSWNLGFMRETERQVEIHLENHLKLLPLSDIKSRKILQKMQEDERNHCNTAQNAGGNSLPYVIKIAMYCVSKIMKVTSFWI